MNNGFGGSCKLFGCIELIEPSVYVIIDLFANNEMIC